jgi:Alpha-L-arabinofuranosidase C-terminal domain
LEAVIDECINNHFYFIRFSGKWLNSSNELLEIVVDRALQVSFHEFLILCIGNWPSKNNCSCRDKRKLSFEEKKEGVYDENKIIALLGKILEFKKSLTEKAENIQDIVEKIEKLTWYNDTDIDCENLMKINDVISAIRDLHYSFKRQCTATPADATIHIEHFKSDRARVISITGAPSAENRPGNTRAVVPMEQTIRPNSNGYLRYTCSPWSYTIIRL